MSKMVQYNLRLPPEMLREVARICEESSLFGRTPVSQFIRAAIVEHVKLYKSNKMKRQRQAHRIDAQAAKEGIQ